MQCLSRIGPNWCGAAVAVLMIVGLQGIVSSTPAAACDVDASGICLNGTEPPEPPSETDPPPVSTGDLGGCHDQTGAEVPCTDGYGGSWSGPPRWCYQYQLDPQPPAESPLWGSNDPATGSLWSCDYSVSVPANTFFVSEGEPVVDAGELARDLVARTPFEYANATTAPGGSAPTYVGFDTWLWVSADQWRPVSASLTVSGATVTIQAAPTNVRWEVGQHHQTCTGPGREWNSQLGEDAETPCSIRVDHLVDPNGDHLEVVARIQYGVTWTCVGVCSAPSGDLGTVEALPGQPAQLEVRQRQTVVTS